MEYLESRPKINARFVKAFGYSLGSLEKLEIRLRSTRVKA